MMIMYPMNDGINILIPSGELPIEETALKDVPLGVPFIYVSKSDIPPDFRGAWQADFSNPDGFGTGQAEWFSRYPNGYVASGDCKDVSAGGAAITINLEKAKKITKDRLRLEREPLLKNLDIEYMRMVESGGDTSGIIAKKQRLRDITDSTDNCTTVDDLRALSCTFVA